MSSVPAHHFPLLDPFLPSQALNLAQLAQVATYLDLLMKWNARINLTSLRSRDEILTRHFGESFFLAHHLFPPSSPVSNSAIPTVLAPNHATEFSDSKLKTENKKLKTHAIDLGSGAGFPGLPLKIFAPHLRVTLIESQNKKAAFLKEVIRALTLMDINVFSGRAEAYLAAQSAAAPSTASALQPAACSLQLPLVTMRAVERFESMLPLAARLLSPRGRLALLTTSTQLPSIQRALPNFSWNTPAPVPLSTHRILLVGSVEN